MSDYGHPISFGLSLIPSVDALEENLRLAQAADQAGLDYLAIQDHAYNAEFLDVWTLISFLAARTERIAFVPDVADLQLRPPTMLAKAAASLSVLAPGRIVLGVGGGSDGRWHRRDGWPTAQHERHDRVHRRGARRHAPGLGR